MKRSHNLLLILLIAGASPAAPDARFGVDDMLDVRTINIAALSDDGKWVAATAGSLRDRIGVDNHRFGDPTYIAPNHVDVMIIETATGRSQTLFPDRRQVTGLTWSPGSARLAMLALVGDGFQPLIWERATGKTIAVAPPPGKVAADNSDLRWTPDGERLLVGLRPQEWRSAAAERFRQETQGVAVVHTSKEPFLAWDEVRRLSLERSLAAYEVKSGKWTEIVPHSKLPSYAISEDGSALIYNQDITKKTDYDTIGGREDEVRVMAPEPGASKVLLKSTKGLTFTWSRDGRHYAYTKDGAVWMGGIEGGEAKQVVGPPKSAPDKDKPEPDEAEKEKRAKERFTAVRLSPKGERLVASNKEGLWVVDTASGAHDLFLKMPEEDKQGPRYQVVDWFGDSIYLSYASRTKWERGMVRYDVAAKKMTDLWKDGRIYGGFRLSKDGGTMVFTAAEGNRPPDVYVASGEMKH